MAEMKYTLTVRRLAPRPRSKHLRECGGATYTAARGTSGTSGTSATALAAQVAELAARLSELRSQVETLSLKAGAEV